MNNELKELLNFKKVRQLDNNKEQKKTNECELNDIPLLYTKNDVYMIALRRAMEITFSRIRLSFEEILNEFSIPKQSMQCAWIEPKSKTRYRFQTLHHNINILDIGSDIQIPTRYDPNMRIHVDIEFRVSWMYRNKIFIQTCNDYYTIFGMEIAFEHVCKNKWKILLKVKDKYIYKPVLLDEYRNKTIH